MKYVDTNVFLYPILYPDSEAKVMHAKGIFFASNVTPLITSALTWDEIVWVVKKRFDIEKAKMEGRKFLSLPNITIVPVDDKLLSNAQNLIERYNLNPRDAIHAATAIGQNVTEFVTDDKDFYVVKELKIKPL